MTTQTEELSFYIQRQRIATACRIMAMEGLVHGTLGHISMRISEDTMLIRGRGPEDCGLFFTTPEEVCLVDYSGNRAESPRGYATPVELPLHGEIYKVRPDVNVVVHAHPPAVLAATLAHLDFVPCFGSFNIPANQIASEGIPIYPRSILISTPEIAGEMIATMGSHRSCILKGHGITVVGQTLESALLSALNVNTLAQVALEIAKTGSRATPIPPEDQALVPKQSKFSPDAGWKFYQAKLRRYGFDS